MIKLLVVGKTGQLSRSIAERAKSHDGIEVTVVGRPELDLESCDSVRDVITHSLPDIVVNTAAYTAVDKAEVEREHAYAINCHGAANVASAASSLRIPHIHFSTDYVFPGDKSSPYREDDATGPLNVYGESKLAGEEAVRTAHQRSLIIRTSWLYSPFGTNFVRTMLRLGQEKSHLRVVNDQIGCPTCTLDLADVLLRILPQLREPERPSFVVHLAAKGATTWCDFARRIFQYRAGLGGPMTAVEGISSAEYAALARRPTNSRLDSSFFEEMFGVSMLPWDASLEEVVRRIEMSGNLDKGFG